MIQYNIYIFILFNYYYHWQLIIFFWGMLNFWAIARWISQCLSVLRPRCMGCWMQQPFCTNCPEWKSRASPSFWFLFGQIIRETPLRISRILKYLGVSCGKQGETYGFLKIFPSLRLMSCIPRPGTSCGPGFYGEKPTVWAWVLPMGFTKFTR